MQSTEPATGSFFRTYGDIELPQIHVYESEAVFIDTKD